MGGSTLEEHKSKQGKFVKKALAAKKAKMKEAVAQAKTLLAEAKTPEEVQAKVPEKGRRGRGRGQLPLEVGEAPPPAARGGSCRWRWTGRGRLPLEVQGGEGQRGGGRGRGQLPEEVDRGRGQLPEEVEEAPPPAAPAAPPPAEGPFKGMQVVVSEEGATKAAYGRQGLVVHHQKGQVTIRCAGDRFAIIQVSEGHVRSAEGIQEMPKRWRINPTKELKLELLREFVPHSLEQEALNGDGSELSNCYLSLYWRLIQEDVDCKGAVFVDPSLSIQATLYFAAGKEEELKQLMQRMAGEFFAEGEKLLMLPIWSGDGGAHWTLLVFERSGLEVRCLRYYDSLTKEHQGCRLAAEWMRDQLQQFWQAAHGAEVRFPDKLPPRWNEARQEIGSSRCGWYVLYYVEKEVRGMRMQLTAMPWPDWGFIQKVMYERLSCLRQTLIKFQDLPEKEKVQAEKVAKEAAERAEAKKKAAESLEFDEELLKAVMVMSMKRLAPVEYPRWGCPKCSHAKAGTPCCNPDKGAARTEAQALAAGVPYMSKECHALPENAWFDRKVYNRLVTKNVAAHMARLRELQEKEALAEFEVKKASLLRSASVLSQDEKELPSASAGGTSEVL